MHHINPGFLRPRQHNQSEDNHLYQPVSIR